MSRHEADLDALIRSAQAERPRGRWQAQRRLFRRLTLGGGVALLLARVSYAFQPLFRAPRLTVGVVGVALAAAVSGSVYGVTPDASPSDDGEEAAVAAASESPVPSAGEHDSTLAEPSIPTVSVDALPTAPQRAQVPRSVGAVAEVRDVEDDLAKETASVSRIRSKLGVRDFSGALSGVRAHRAAFPHGLLAQEVTVLEIEAHQGLGHEERACALGRAFLDAHPTSAHRTRVSGLLRSCNR
jgi:hypothetical protein